MTATTPELLRVLIVEVERFRASSVDPSSEAVTIANLQTILKRALAEVEVTA